MPYGPTDFRSTVVKLYYTDKLSKYDITIIIETRTEDENKESITVEPNAEGENTVRKRGRGRPRKNATYTSASLISASFISAKEKADFELSVKLRQEGVITTPGKPFEQSDRKEIDALVARGVFAFEQYDEHKHHERIFKSRIVREVKGKQTSTPYEKSRLVI